MASPSPPVFVNGESSTLSSFPFDRQGRSNGSTTTNKMPNGIQWPPTPAEPPRTPERRIAPSPSPSPEPEPGTFLNGHKIRARSMPPLGQVPGPYEQEGDRGRARTHSKIRTYADDQKIKQFPRISKPVELMRISYDCVVIGSGYGGAVAASRMARAGRTVCVLELGKEKWPGEYPSSTKEALDELHCSGELTPSFVKNGLKIDSGKPTGMYHLIFGKGQNAVVCNGLGGTSLMNANVFLRADNDTMAMKTWPKELREPGALDPYYDKVERVLQPEPYPEDWPALPKLDLLEKQAKFLNKEDKFYRVKQTTRFKNGPNSCGVEMSASALTGQDCTGINDGSKTTTLVTYLADSWNWGAELFCECEVRYIEKVPKGDKRGGYNIYFAWHGRNRGHFKANLHGDLMWVHARDAVFFGAGAIGTTEILLRSKAMGLGMSDLVGQNMSGNGDILSFGYNTDHQTNAMGRTYPSPYRPIGPTITGIIDDRTGHDNPLDGYVIQEGAVPHALARFLQVMCDFLPGEEPETDTLYDRTQAKLARWGSRLIGPYYKNGALERTQIYLIMSHDSNQAVLTLQDDKPVLEFLGVGRSNHVKFLNEQLRQATMYAGGKLVNNPFFALMGQQVTVHPIGGASMARDGSGRTGVTDHVGRLFTGNAEEVHDGLIVTDGAVIPAALGANPLATIAALAERSVADYARRKDLDIDDEENGILDLFGEPAHTINFDDVNEERSYEDEKTEAETTRIYNTKKDIHKATAIKAGGFGFTEVMSGYLHRDRNMKEDHKDTYELAYRTAKSLCESARFFLSVQSFNTKDTVNDPDHRGLLTGTFVCPTIRGSPFMVQRGEFNLFVMDHKAPGTRNLTYDFDMTGINGGQYHFHGYKVVDSSVALAPLQFWRSTSTLYVTVTEKRPRNLENEHTDETWRQGCVIAKGIMHIYPTDFISQIMTMTPTGSSLLKKAVSAASFMSYFTRKSLSLFLAPLTTLQYPSQTYAGFINDTRPCRVWTDITARDGVKTRLYVWEPTYKPDGKVMNLFMIPGASVDHQIYALPTIPFNAVNYFRRAGYRVFVTVHRIGQLMIAENNWTTFDARLDIRAALAQARQYAWPDIEEKDRPRMYTIAHCMGSVAFSAGLLDGTIPADWILGVTCSQVFMNPIWNTMNMIKACEFPVGLDKAYRLLAGSWFSCSTSTDDTLVQRALNQLLRFYPDERREICNSAACHRTSLVFGRCWNHRNLNEATHRQIDRFFGGVNMTLLHLLMRQGSAGHVMDNAGRQLTTPDNIKRLKGIPFLLFVGRDNAVLNPTATEATYETLCDTFGTAAGPQGGIMYRRKVVPGYGHLDCWMGRNAWKDVYPFVREEVDRWTRGETYRFQEPSALRCPFTRMMESGELLY